MECWVYFYNLVIRGSTLILKILLLFSAIDRGDVNKIIDPGHMRLSEYTQNALYLNSWDESHYHCRQWRNNLFAEGLLISKIFFFVYLQDAPENTSVESQLSADISCKFCKDEMAPVTLALKVSFFRCSRAALLGHFYLDVTLIQGTRTWVPLFKEHFL